MRHLGQKYWQPASTACNFSAAVPAVCTYLHAAIVLPGIVFAVTVLKAVVCLYTLPFLQSAA